MTAQLLGLTAHMALAIWLGGMVFFSFVAAPALFRGLGREEAGRAMRAVFPGYYRMGALCGGAFVTAVSLRAAVSPGADARRGAEAILGAAMLALTLYGWRVLLPRVEDSRLRLESGNPTHRTDLEAHRFRSLHLRSARLNAILILLGLVTLALRAIVS